MFFVSLTQVLISLTDSIEEKSINLQWARILLLADTQRASEQPAESSCLLVRTVMDTERQQLYQPVKSPCKKHLHQQRAVKANRASLTLSFKLHSPTIQQARKRISSRQKPQHIVYYHILSVVCTCACVCTKAVACLHLDSALFC